MTDFATRLRDERKRLNLTQNEFARMVGITPNTQLRYEKGKAKPAMTYVLALAENGLDTNYLLTGQRSHASEQEKAMLNLLNALPQAQQAMAFGMLNMLLQTAAPVPEPQSQALWRAAHLYAAFLDMGEAGRELVEYTVSAVQGYRAQS